MPPQPRYPRAERDRAWQGNKREEGTTPGQGRDAREQQEKKKRIIKRDNRDRRTIEGAYLRRKILKNKSNIYVFPQADGQKTIIVNNEGRKRDKTSKNNF